MKHLANIVNEFNELVKIARKWDDLSYDDQKGYLKRHPLSRRKITAKPDGQKSLENSQKNWKSKSKKRLLKEKINQKRQPGTKRNEGRFSGRDSDDYDDRKREGQEWRKEKFNELKKSLPNDQKEWATYLIKVDKDGESYANQIKEMYKGKPIILDMHGSEPRFIVPTIVQRYKHNFARWSSEEFGEPQYPKMLDFETIEDAKSFIDEEPELAKKVELRNEIEKVTSDIHENYRKTVVPEADHYLQHMYIADRLAKMPREDQYGTQHNVDGTTEEYVAAKGQSFKLSADDHKKIDHVINNPSGSTVEDVKFTIDNFDKFIDDVTKYKTLNKDAWDVRTAQEFLDQRNGVKKGLKDSISKLQLKDKLITQHGFETKADIVLPEGFEFRDKPKLSYEDYNDIILGNDNMEIHLSLGKPGQGKHGGEVYYKVPEKDGLYSLGRPGFDSGISTDWDDGIDVNQLIQEKINEVKAKQDKISQMTVKIPIKDAGTWNVTPERFEAMKNELKSGKWLTFSPHGMGTGYNVSTRPTRHGWRASRELEDMFGGVPLYIESYDHD